MKAGSSDRDDKKMLEFDKKKIESESVEDNTFDHKTRNAVLESGKFNPPSGTIFEAIFQELKRKEEREKNRYSLSSVIPRFHTRRAKK